MKTTKGSALSDLSRDDLSRDDPSRGDASPDDASPGGARSFDNEIEAIASSYAAAFKQATDEQALRDANARLVGPAGSLTRLLKAIPTLPKPERPAKGRQANQLKGEIARAFDAKLKELEREARVAELNAPPLDPTLPGRSVRHGRLHPIRRTMDDLLDIFVSLGFDVADAPEVDSVSHNFDKLGFPPDHPATDMQDSFFVGPGTVLRTHTTTIQVHQMLARKPPMAVVCAGSVYRRDDDATHSPMFAQIDGFAVDKGLSFAHLKSVLVTAIRRLLGDEIAVRFRPSYFPFVEPGGEMDVRWGDEWMEILGCGMIHPVVFESVGVDPKAYTGFAFGMGIDRIAMRRFGIPNIKLLYENDVRFLSRL